MAEVTPLAGVWIEISWANTEGAPMRSLPSRECGLKFRGWECRGHWRRHSPRGSVD